MYAHGIIRQILSLTIARKQSVSLAFGRKEKFYWLLEEKNFQLAFEKKRKKFYLFKVSGNITETYPCNI